MTGTEVAAAGVVTAWGEGIARLPADARAAAGDRRVVPLGRPAVDGDRFRRATRECVLAVTAVEAMLREGGCPRETLGGDATALVFVTAAAYGASNVEFIQAGLPHAAGEAGGPSALRFPYTAPSAVPAEVAIAYGVSGPYVILIGGAAATVDGLWQASLLLAGGRCERALVLAVETYAESAALWARGRWHVRWPLVEAAACALLVRGPRGARYHAQAEPAPLEARAGRRAGETLACAPLIALALARAEGGGRLQVTGTWRGRCSGLELDVAPAVA